MATPLVGMLYILIQACYNAYNPERETQDTTMMPLVLEYFSFGTIGVLCLWDAYRSKVLSRALATFEILRIVLWIPHDDLFAAILTFLQLSSAISTIYVYFSGYEYATLVTYVLWLLAWMCLIYYIGRILDDIGTLKRKP